MDIRNVMESLSERRPIFHLEADFQFALAWEIQKKHPTCDVRLEVPAKLNKNARIDIIVQLDGSIYPIELKYLKKAMTYMTTDGELFSLAEGVHDMDMYGCIADVSRLETLCEKFNYQTGYAVWLTNDSAYWDKDYNASYYKEFHAPDGAVKTGTMYYSAINPRTNKPPQILDMKEYQNPITLNGSYEIKWYDYANLGGTVPKGIFKYAVIEVG